MLAETGATLILLHHASKSRDGERASNAARGSNALPAEATQIMQFNWLKPDNKQDQRIAITTEGRNSKPVDIVVEQIQRAQWISHGSSEAIKEELRLEKEESKLNDRQELVLTFINALEKFNPIDPADLSTKLATEFGDTTGKVKALATLNQLYRRGLIKKKTFATVDRGNVAIFFPRSWHESELSLLTYKT